MHTLSGDKDFADVTESSKYNEEMSRLSRGRNISVSIQLLTNL